MTFCKANPNYFQLVIAICSTSLVSFLGCNNSNNQSNVEFEAANWEVKLLEGESVQTIQEQAALRRSRLADRLYTEFKESFQKNRDPYVSIHKMRIGKNVFDLIGQQIENDARNQTKWDRSTEALLHAWIECYDPRVDRFKNPAIDWVAPLLAKHESSRMLIDVISLNTRARSVPCENETLIEELMRCLASKKLHSAATRLLLGLGVEESVPKIEEIVQRETNWGLLGDLNRHSPSPKHVDMLKRMKDHVTQDNWRSFSSELSGICYRDRQNGDAASFAYDLQQFDCFVAGAGDQHHAEIQHLFDNRSSLAFHLGEAYQLKPTQYPASWRYHDMVVNDDPSISKFVEAIPGPKTGFETGYNIDEFATLLSRLDAEFARPMMLELMKEGVPEAFHGAGKLWEGTNEKEVVEILKQELGKEHKAGGSGTCIPSKIFASLHSVSPSEASKFPKFKSELERLERLRNIKSYTELEKLMLAQGFDARQVEGAKKRIWFSGLPAEYQVLVQELYERIGLSAEIEYRLDFEMWKNGAEQLESTLEFMGDYTNGKFKPSVVVKHLDDAFVLHVALDDQVYEIKNAVRLARASPTWMKSSVALANELLKNTETKERFIAFDSNQLSIKFIFADPALATQKKWLKAFLST